MDLFTNITFDQIALTVLTLGVVREAMIQVLPNDVAGPGGWLVNTGEE
ncbi:hypothetical protein [Actibacterium lipolyticum]|nr:hypothetical protein [Actibacterium lipolyticum]